MAGFDTWGGRGIRVAMCVTDLLSRDLSSRHKEAKMFKKILMLMLIALLFATQSGTNAFAASQATKNVDTQEKVKANVDRAGLGAKARVTVKMKDGTERKGYVSERHDADFILRDHKTDAPTTIAYNDVARVHVDHGHSTARNTTIGVLIGVGAVVTVLAVLVASIND
jgi:hypothetical protein